MGGIEATSLRLLGKLDQLMPMRLRRKATALHAVTLSLRGNMPPLVDAGLLSEIATACRDARVLRFGYRSHAGDASQRHVQPLRLKKRCQGQFEVHRTQPGTFAQCDQGVPTF